MNKFETGFYKLVELLSAVLLCFMVILVFTNIIFRYFLNLAIASTEELSRFAFIWISFIGAALCLRTNEHLSIDIITNLLPKRLKSAVYIFDQVFVLAICVIFTIGGVNMTISDLPTRSPATDVSFGYIDAIVPLMSAIMIIIQLKKIYLYISQKSKTTNSDMQRGA